MNNNGYSFDSFGRPIPEKLKQYMKNSSVRDGKGRLLCVYAIGPNNGIMGRNPNIRFTLWSEKPATMNLQRGLNGVEAYGQEGKRCGEKIKQMLSKLNASPDMPEVNKKAIQQIIAVEELKNREFTSYITRLNPWHPDFVSRRSEDLIGNRVVLEAYINIQSPMVIDAGGYSIDYVREIALKLIRGQSDASSIKQGDFFDFNDGLKVINVKVTKDGQSLGGGILDTDTIYVTFRHNQAKSTYNTEPTDTPIFHY